MHNEGPPILFCAIWGLFAAVMLFTQYEIASSGGKLMSIADIQNSDVTMQLASLE